MNWTGRFGAVIGAAAVAAACAWAADNITPLDVKTGQWETNVTMAHTGAPPIPPEALARMPPEQRAKLEERFKAGAAPTTHVSKHCLTKEDLAKSFSGYDTNPNCKRTILSSTSHAQDFKVECTNQAMTSVGTGHVEAVDSEHIQGKIKMTMNSANGTMVIDSSFQSRWLGSTCEAAKK